MSSSPEPSLIPTDTTRRFSMSVDNFAIELPSPHVGYTSSSALRSPSVITPNPLDRRTLSFSREGILGSAQKARNLSQSSGDRETAISTLRQIANGNLSENTRGSDDGINPLKRRNTDAGSDYPRRRATIAVS